MENKLQQLTQKLYDEGLEKGRAEAERLVAEAKTNAAKIVKEAEAQAAKILAEANTKAQDVEKNAMTEISLAGKQALSKIKAEISSMIIAKSTAPAVKAATLDPEFVKQMLLTVAKNWSGADSSKNQLKALLPEAEQKAFEATFEAAAKELLAAGVEVGYSKEVRTGFKVGAKDGGYYISFSDQDFDALLKEYLRDKAAGLHPDVPCNYYPDDDDTRAPICSWRSSANLLYCNWLNYFVYQATPYDLNRVGIVVMDDFKEQHDNTL